MITNPCRKCGKLIYSHSIILHEAMCKGPINLVDSDSPHDDINSIESEINGNEINTTNFNGINSNQQNRFSDNGIINTSNSNIPHHNQEEQFYHCAKCDIYIDIHDREDHILCHQYENHIDVECEGEGESEVRSEDETHSVDSQDNIRNYQHQNFPRINSNFQNREDTGTTSTGNRGPFTENYCLNSNSSSSMSNTISYNNGVRTETVTRIDPQGRVTTITRTYNSGNSNIPNYSYNTNSNRNVNNFNFGEISSEDEDDHGLRGRHLPQLPNITHIPRSENMNNLNQIFSGRINSRSGHSNIHPHFTILNNSRDLESLLRHILQGVNPEHPVDEELLNLLPEITIENTEKLPAEKRDCVVCLTKYEINDKVIILPCTHLFHTKCISDWFKTQNTCPICKYKIDSSNINADQ